MNRDNLAKRRKVEDDNCLFCIEKENIHHLFFDCAIAKQCWKIISEALDCSILRVC